MDLADTGCDCAFVIPACAGLHHQAQQASSCHDTGSICFRLPVCIDLRKRRHCHGAILLWTLTGDDRIRSGVRPFDRGMRPDHRVLVPGKDILARLGKTTHHWIVRYAAGLLAGSAGCTANIYVRGCHLGPLELADRCCRCQYPEDPGFNFPGWMLIMLYGSACLLVGRWWYRKSGYRPVVGIVYPFIAMFAALLLMISPISNLLLWLGPIFQKGSSIEWIMLAFHLLVPTLLLVFFWRGRMTKKFTAEDLPVFLVPTVLHLSDILFTFIGGYTEIVWIVLLASFAQTAFLAFAYWNNRRLITLPEPGSTG